MSAQRGLRHGGSCQDEERRLNYRHDFHAGNLHDVLKHAVWLGLVQAALADAAPLTVVETHAGAGLYDLGGEAGRRTGEAAGGVGRLLAEARDPATPALLLALVRAVESCRRRAGPRSYPGSPVLAAERLRLGDRYIGWELRGDDHGRLALALREAAPPGVRAVAALGDGYAGAPGVEGSRRLVMLDPPYERGDELQRLAEAVGALRARPGPLVTVVWAPLKDLDALDRLAAAVGAASPVPGWMVELRARPLDHPLRLNGSALLVHGAPAMEASALEAAAWLAERLGEPGARAVATPLSPGARQPRA